MQLADLTIEQSQQAGEQLVSTYKGVLNVDGMFISASRQFESESLTLLEEGWQLKRVSHRGTLLSPEALVVAIYEK